MKRIELDKLLTYLERKDDEYISTLVNDLYRYHDDKGTSENIVQFICYMIKLFPNINYSMKDITKLIVCEMCSRYADENISYGINRDYVRDLFYDK